MLLEFSVGNYRSFAEEASLSMVAAPRQRGLDYSVHSVKAGGRTYRTLSTAVIYGPNASGKTTVIGALDTLKGIIGRGNIRNVANYSGSNLASFRLELIPNSSLPEPRLVAFRTRFIEGGVEYDYRLECDLGGFGDALHRREIALESLSVNGGLVFERCPNSIYIDASPLDGGLARGYAGNEEAIADLASNVDPTDLFLTSVFKTFVSPSVARAVISWFEEKLVVFYRADCVRAVRAPLPMPSGPFMDESIARAARAFGVRENGLTYMVPEGESEPRLFSLVKGGDGAERRIPAEDYESFGTVRFIDLFPVLVDAITRGATLAVDEFDASMHPAALTSIISAFHNDDINRLGAQLIFDTHNPVYLNGGVLRRDEVKFVERDEETGSSRLYSLSDFGTSGPGSPRLGKNYMNGYLEDRFGAIDDVDLSDAFAEALGLEGGEE